MSKPQRTASNLNRTELNHLNELLSADRGLLDKFSKFDDESPDIALDRVDHWQGGKKVASYREAV